MNIINKIAALALICTSAAFAQDELRLAVIVSRHGVRSPTWTPERLNQYSAAPWPDWGVAPGLLTPHGRELMKIMGGFYKEYFRALALDCDKVYFRADSALRTRVTAEALAEGIVPGCKTEVHAGKEGERDSLFDGSEGSDTKLLNAAVMGRLGPRLDSLVAAHQPALDLLAQTLTGGAKTKRSIFEEPLAVTDNSMSGPINLASTLSEDFLLEYTDGMSGDKFGWGRLTPAKLLDVLSLHTAYADVMRRTSTLARARGGNLLNTVLNTLEQAETGKAVAGATGPVGAKLVVISGHDTNISNLSGILGLSWVLPSYQPDDTPPGGALLFTLWKSANGGSSVRVQYAAQTLDQMHDAAKLTLTSPPAIANVFVPGCSSAADGFPCNAKGFREAASK